MNMATSASTEKDPPCVTCSSGCIATARRFQLTEEAAQSYFENVLAEIAQIQNFPSIRREVEWTVYMISPSRMFTHQSLLFVCEQPQYSGNPGFTFELTYGELGSSNEVIPNTDFMMKNEKAKKLGVVTESAYSIMVKGLKCLANFGDYNTVTKNCQDFCRSFAKELKIKQPTTDVQTVAGLAAVAVGVVGAIGLAATAIASIMGKRENPNDDGDPYESDSYMYDSD